MKLQGKQAIVLVEDMYQELEVWYPLLRLREEGAKVVLVAPEKGRTYKSKLGYPAVSEAAAADIDVAEYDAVVIPGGYAPDMMRRNAAMVNIVRKAFDLGKVVASICHGGWMLCSADVLKGKTATCFFAIKDDQTHAGARFVDEEVVVDGNLITSRKPDDLPAFMRAIIDRMA